MRNLVYSYSDFLPLGPKPYYLEWEDSTDVPAREWRIKNIVDHGFDTFSAAIQRASHEVNIYTISIELDDGTIGLDRADPDSVPLEIALLKNSYIYNAKGGLKSLDGMSFREFYSSEASHHEYLFSIEFMESPSIELARDIAICIADGDIQELGRTISKIRKLTIWPRSRERCYLISASASLALEDLKSILSGSHGKIKAR